MLESAKDHVAIAAVREQTVHIATIGLLPWLFLLLVKTMELLNQIGIRVSFSVFLDWCTEQVEAKRKVSAPKLCPTHMQDPENIDVASHTMVLTRVFQLH